MKYNFNQKSVWLTGASSGIGLLLAKTLLEAGAKVAVSSRNEEKLVQLFSEFDNALIVAGDLTCRRTNSEIVAKIKASFGCLDCVILNAGNAEYIDIQNFDHQPFENMMQTNYLSMVKGIAAALPELRQSKYPYLVGMSSSVAWQGLPQGQAYSASKAAIRNLFQGLKIELASENIAVSWICPGFVKTPLTDKNDFPMPFSVSAEKAVETILNQLQKQKTEIHFPKRFTWFLKFVAMLPAGLAAKLLSNTVPTKE
jgi:short-subunit dehydrogenase